MEDKLPKGKRASHIAAAVGDRLISIITFILATVMLLYGIYVLYDNAYLNHKAFISQDLLQYKPDANASDDLLGFSNILELNPDTVGWLTIYNTNINYPVMQGRDNTEYLNKDPHGDFSLSGSIYLDVGNDSKFTDKYNIIFGHHMASGAMFGDIDKYREESFFRSHQEGMLQTPTGNYNLNVFALLRGDAYDQTIYSVTDINSIEHTETMFRFVGEHAIWYDSSSIPDMQKGKIIVLSTCTDAYTNGRLLLFCAALPRQTPLPGNEAKPTIHRDPVGHEKGKWSLLDLCCTALAIIILLPLAYTRKKYHQINYSRRTADALAKMAPDDPLAITTAAEQGADYIPNVIKMLCCFYKRLLIGTAAETIISLGSIILLLLTQDFTNPMVMTDNWTPLFIGLTTSALFADYICFRYRGDKPPVTEIKTD